MLSAVLEGADMTALVALDAESAISLLSHITPDLILMDGSMPRMDGFEATRAIKSRETFAHIPVVFMTGLSEPENIVKGFRGGRRGLYHQAHCSGGHAGAGTRIWLTPASPKAQGGH